MVLVGRNMKERDCFEDLGVGGKVVLMLKKKDDKGGEVGVGCGWCVGGSVACQSVWGAW